MNQAGLVAEGLTVAYGGNLAVEDVSFDAPLGRITGLIGPNGAGKTTTFNACNGLLRPSVGRIRLGGRDITRTSTSRRARMGLGRTFQRVEICNGMTVAENVLLGAVARQAGRSLLRQLGASPAGHQATREAAAGALERCGIAAIGGRSASTLTTGQRRLVELARALAGGFELLLLDEPSSGLDADETTQFGEIIRSVAANGTGVLLVEHDMALVMSVCDHIDVLDFGRLIFSGTPAEVQSSPVVRAAYLGSEAEELTP